MLFTRRGTEAILTGFTAGQSLAFSHGRFKDYGDTTVEKLLAGADAKVVRFQRYEVGEGIEKKVENFAEEVMAQVRGE